MTVATRCHTIIWQLLLKIKNLTSDDLTKFLFLWSGWAELCQGMTSLSRAVVPRSICSPKNHFAPWHTVRREVEKLSNERDKIKFIIFGLLKSVHIPHPTSQFSFLRKAKYVCLHGAIYAKLKVSQGAFAGLDSECCLNFLNVIQSIFGLAS